MAGSEPVEPIETPDEQVIDDPGQLADILPTNVRQRAILRQAGALVEDAHADEWGRISLDVEDLAWAAVHVDPQGESISATKIPSNVFRAYAMLRDNNLLPTAISTNATYQRFCFLAVTMWLVEQYRESHADPFEGLARDLMQSRTEARLNYEEQRADRNEQMVDRSERLLSRAERNGAWSDVRRLVDDGRQELDALDEPYRTRMERMLDAYEQRCSLNQHDQT